MDSCLLPFISGSCINRGLCGRLHDELNECGRELERVKRRLYFRRGLADCIDERSVTVALRDDNIPHRVVNRIVNRGSLDAAGACLSDFKSTRVRGIALGSLCGGGRLGL